ncbi:Sorting nexin, cytoplasm-to-vacuole targeting pathway/endosomal sorting [Ceratobasidium sp. UAMH 11750]|nr:Sorting nexin, cytoplasm-to-vacuole targeting pathway/endosomal sorting [Ceratobasidium sp. UAMH 11750]
MADNTDEVCCARAQWLHSGDEPEILITDAQKSSEGSGSVFIAYVIRSGNSEARRRYSEFESLRNSLSKLYPTLIVPPIPSKQSLGDYAIKQSKAKEDASLIARRRRMLQVFLNRIARHPILSNEHVFHRFLERDVSWVSLMLHSSLKKVLRIDLVCSPRFSTPHLSSTSLKTYSKRLPTTRPKPDQPMPRFPYHHHPIHFTDQTSASSTLSLLPKSLRHTLMAHLKKSLGALQNDGLSTPTILLNLALPLTRYPFPYHPTKATQWSEQDKQLMPHMLVRQNWFRQSNQAGPSPCTSTPCSRRSSVDCSSTGTRNTYNMK